MKVWTVIFALLCAASARGEPPQPEVLYHWASFDNLKRVSKLNRGKDGYPIDTIWDGQWLSLTYPELEGKPGIYTWTHPVAGMAADLTEIYGGEALVKLKLRPGLRVAEVESREGLLKQPLPQSAKRAQLLLHKRYDKSGRLYYQEWVLLDRNAVEGYSASPEASRAELEREIARLESKTFRYSDDVLHFLDPDDKGASRSVLNQEGPRRQLLGYLRRFLKADLRRIAPRFRRSLSTPVGGCTGPYEDVGGGS